MNKRSFAFRWAVRFALLGTGAVLGFGLLYGWHLHRIVAEELLAAPPEPVIITSAPIPLQVGSRWQGEELASDLGALGFRVDRIDSRALFLPANNLRIESVGGRITNLHVAGAERSQVELPAVPIATLFEAERKMQRHVSLDAIPEALLVALQASEDRRFGDHPGVDLRGVARALWFNLREGARRQGGSTLTQQLARTLYLKRDRSVPRKLNEILLALYLESRYSKADILEAYINSVFLGQSGAVAVHGFEAAAQHYFGQPLEELGTAQIALLVGLLPGPSIFHPWRYPERASRTRFRVLDDLYETGVISRSERDQLHARPLGVLAEPPAYGQRFPAFLQLAADVTPPSGSTVVETTLEPLLQRKLQRVVDRLPAELQGAGLIIERQSGAVRAVVAGRAYRAGEFHRVLNARRPIGSLIKPFVYLAALHRRPSFELYTPVIDAPIEVPLEGGRIWRPKNYSGNHRGTVQLIDALADSLNLATVQLGMQVGLPAVVSELRAHDAPVPALAHPSLLLGAVEWTPLEVARAYLQLLEGTDRRLQTAADTRPRALPEPATFLVEFALRETVASGTAQRALGGSQRSLGGKTGTSDGGRDSWFVGFDGGHLGVVWVGRDDNRPADLTGGRQAAEIFASALEQLPEVPLLSTTPEIRWERIAEVDSQGRPRCSRSRALPVRNPVAGGWRCP